MPLDLGESLAADEEVLPHHSQVAVPSLQVVDRCVLFLREGERKSRVSDSLLVRDPERFFLHRLLVLQNAYDKGFEDFECVRRVVVRLDARPLNQRVSAIKELADVTTEVLTKDELAARVQALVAVEVENEVVEDE